MPFIVDVEYFLLYSVALLSSVFAWKAFRASFYIQDSYAETYAEKYGADSMRDTYRLMSYLRRAGIGYVIACIATLICSLSLLRIVASTYTSFMIIMYIGVAAIAWATFCYTRVRKLASNAVKELDDIIEIKKDMERHDHDGSSRA